MKKGSCCRVGLQACAAFRTSSNASSAPQKGWRRRRLRRVDDDEPDDEWRGVWGDVKKIMSVIFERRGRVPRSYSCVGRSTRPRAATTHEAEPAHGAERRHEVVGGQAYKSSDYSATPSFDGCRGWHILLAGSGLCSRDQGLWADLPRRPAPSAGRAGRATRTLAARVRAEVEGHRQRVAPRPRAGGRRPITGGGAADLADRESTRPGRRARGSSRGVQRRLSCVRSGAACRYFDSSHPLLRSLGTVGITCPGLQTKGNSPSRLQKTTTKPDVYRGMELHRSYIFSFQSY